MVELYLDQPHVARQFSMRSLLSSVLEIRPDADMPSAPLCRQARRTLRAQGSIDTSYSLRFSRGSKPVPVAVPVHDTVRRTCRYTRSMRPWMPHQEDGGFRFISPL